VWCREATTTQRIYYTLYIRRHYADITHRCRQPGSIRSRLRNTPNIPTLYRAWTPRSVVAVKPLKPVAK